MMLWAGQTILFILHSLACVPVITTEEGKVSHCCELAQIRVLKLA